MAIVAGLVLGAVSAAAQPQPSIDTILPTMEQLGKGWTSNRIAVLVDPLSSRSPESESPGWLESAHRVVGKNGCEAHGVIRYHHGSDAVLVWINRFNSRESIRPDWGRDKETKAKVEKLPDVGEEVRFYQRQGRHNNIAFRRGAYLIDVEGVGAPIGKLKQMAELLDANLIKRQNVSGAKIRNRHRTNSFITLRAVHKHGLRRDRSGRAACHRWTERCVPRSEHGRGRI